MFKLLSCLLLVSTLQLHKAGASPIKIQLRKGAPETPKQVTTDGKHVVFLPYGQPNLHLNFIPSGNLSAGSALCRAQGGLLATRQFAHEVTSLATSTYSNTSHSIQDITTDRALQFFTIDARTTSWGVVCTKPTAIHCADPGSRYRIPLGFTFAQQTAIFTCQGGARLVGQSRIQCDRNGIWSATLPRCEVIEYILCQGSYVFFGPQSTGKSSQNQCPHKSSVSHDSTCNTRLLQKYGYDDKMAASSHNMSVCSQSYHLKNVTLHKKYLVFLPYGRPLLHLNYGPRGIRGIEPVVAMCRDKGGTLATKHFVKAAATLVKSAYGTINQTLNDTFTGNEFRAFRMNSNRSTFVPVCTRPIITSKTVSGIRCNGSHYFFPKDAQGHFIIGNDTRHVCPKGSHPLHHAHDCARQLLHKNGYQHHYSFAFKTSTRYGLLVCKKAATAQSTKTHRHGNEDATKSSTVTQSTKTHHHGNQQPTKSPAVTQATKTHHHENKHPTKSHDQSSHHHEKKIAHLRSVLHHKLGQRQKETHHHAVVVKGAAKVKWSLSSAQSHGHRNSHPSDSGSDHDSQSSQSGSNYGSQSSESSSDHGSHPSESGSDSASRSSQSGSDSGSSSSQSDSNPGSRSPQSSSESRSRSSQSGSDSRSHLSQSGSDSGSRSSQSGSDSGSHSSQSRSDSGSRSSQSGSDSGSRSSQSGSDSGSHSSQSGSESRSRSSQSGSDSGSRSSQSGSY